MKKAVIHDRLERYRCDDLKKETPPHCSQTRGDNRAAMAYPIRIQLRTRPQPALLESAAS